jgi:S1-C subfamily serine protease
MNRKRFAITAGIGCSLLVLLLIFGVPILLFFPFQTGHAMVREVKPVVEHTPAPGAAATQQAIPTFTPPSAPVTGSTPVAETETGTRWPGLESDSLTTLYQQFNPGVVNIRVLVDREGLGGVGAGSGFILNEQGYIVTNNHVVAQAEQVTVIFYNEFEANAEVIGTDPDSDLAIIKVDQLAEGARPLSLADSDAVEVGDWVVAIGNPFGQQSSMSLGIVSAVGRMIPSGTTPFAIPQAIQTDAAINPGNSGGPLLNLRGEVIGVNAQIASANSLSNSGVGFAIPANVVRRVIPVLIETGSYQWPWLGVEGGSVNLALMKANNLKTQQGAYISAVVPDGPADKAGLQGASDTIQMNGIDIVTGGDVVIEADDEPVVDFSDLLARTAFKTPGDTMALTVLRDGQRQQLTVELEARPDDFTQTSASSSPR